jgi:histidine triad (HIT) family protein
MNGRNAKQTKLFENETSKTAAVQPDGTLAKPTSKTGCDFCAIVKNDVQRHIVFRDNISIGFLDKKPLFPGHCLLIPTEHYETMIDLPRELIGPLFENAQILARAVRNALESEGIFIAINNKVSQSVPHLHIHVVPRRFGDGLKGFFWPRQTYSSEQQMTEICNSIRATIEKHVNC